MFNDEAFGKMKKGARIVNVARGGVIDEDALARALDNGQVAQVKDCTACMHACICKPSVAHMNRLHQGSVRQAWTTASPYSRAGALECGGPQKHPILGAVQLL